MTTSAKSFVAGLVVGVTLASVGAYSSSSRYKIESSGPSGIISMRVDTWTGKTWMYRYTEENGVKTWFWDPMLDAK